MKFKILELTKTAHWRQVLVCELVMEAAATLALRRLYTLVEWRCRELTDNGSVRFGLCTVYNHIPFLSYTNGVRGMEHFSSGIPSRLREPRHGRLVVPNQLKSAW